MTVLLTAAAPLQAQRPLWPTLSASVGSYFTVNDTDLRVDVGNDLGTEVDFESDFGIDDDLTLVSLKLDWSPWERHQFSLGYFEYDRSASRGIDRQIEIGGITYPIGAEVSAQFEHSEIEASYTYWLTRTPAFGFGLSGGLVYLGLKESSAASFRLGGVTVRRAQDRDANVPVPMIGAQVKGRPWAHTILYAGARGLPEVKIGDIEGEALTYFAGAEYYFWQDRLGVGAAYDGNVYQVDVDESDWQGTASLEIEGWRFYGRFAW